MREGADGRPKPLYFSSACQLGFHRTRGVPSILDALLPPSGAPAACRKYLRRLLLLPPPPGVGAAIRTACRLLGGEGFSPFSRQQ